MTPSIVHIVYVEQLLSVNIKNNVPFTYPVFLTVQWFLLRTLVSCLCCESPLWKRRTDMDVVRIIQLIYTPDHLSTLLRSPILANENSLFLRNKWMRANISHCDSRSTNFNFNLSIFRNTSTLLKKRKFLEISHLEVDGQHDAHVLKIGRLGWNFWEFWRLEVLRTLAGCLHKSAHLTWQFVL